MKRLGVAAAALLLAGCFETFKTSGSIRTKSETELGVSAIKPEWLKRCEWPAGVMPENQNGALLQDYADMAAAFADCKRRHNSFIEYMKPLVQKERGGGN